MSSNIVDGNSLFECGHKEYNGGSILIWVVLLFN